ncbi:MAG TPA: heterodisulfide reductase-related iron-sulfur binding cluster [Steroidobacteraceae bacterium]|nr:heterodisulfide reductase-related iron-sulfur binding cluster [Steroidobacteraceae bacterium]
MSNELPGGREGSLEAPTRHPLGWEQPAFYDRSALEKELERVFDICHGCRRCFNLCNAFPTLFEAVDESATGELASVDRKAFWKVVDHCYLCDMCYMTKCPYVPPHPWNVDFPHLMLRAKAVRHAESGASFRDRVLSSTEAVGRIAGIPVVVEAVNAVNRSRTGRRVLQKALGVHAAAPVPKYHSRTFRRRDRKRVPLSTPAQAVGETRGKVALFVTCYCNRNEPDIAADLVKVFEHNGIPVSLAPNERCCGMPKLELGDLQAVAKLGKANVATLTQLIDAGHDIVAPVPSCVLMFKQELPLMFPEDAAIARVRDHIFDPFEYLMLRHRAGLLKTDFKRELGKVAYHVPCHLRVQNLGLKTRDLLLLVPGTSIEVIERCSGHNGTYAVKEEFHEVSMKIGRPVAQKVNASGADHYSSDCPMAGHQIENGLEPRRAPEHPLTLLRMAYGL